MALLAGARKWPLRPTVCVTTMDILFSEYAALGRTYIIGECNRRTPIRAAKVAALALRVVWKERPNVLITTGAMPMAILACFVKLFGGKIVWIDCSAQVVDVSLSGRFVRLFADLFLVQRETLASNDKRVEFAGTLL